jgi:predicted ArsR family transcriptional regulator
MTVHEIASLCRLDAHAVGKRMAELERDGDVEVARDLMGDVTRPSPSGRLARVWRRVALHVTGTRVSTTQQPEQLRQQSTTITTKATP